MLCCKGVDGEPTISDTVSSKHKQSEIHDLLMMCKQLNMEDSVQEIMHQLGADESGRISYNEFAKCRMQLMNEINSAAQQIDNNNGNDADPVETKCDSTNSGSNPNLQVPKMTSWPTSSDNSMGEFYSKNYGACSGGVRESWEYDSGARDLSPEPNTLQKLMDGATSGGGASGQSSNFLELANTLHLAALASLKGEIIELTNRLQHVTAERDSLERKLAKTQGERARLIRDSEERQDQQAQRYEERIIELHSVIAELNKKLDRSQGNVFREEDEYSQSECTPPSNISQSGGSGSASCQNGSETPIEHVNDLNAELSRVVGELEHAMDYRKVAGDYRQNIMSVEQQVEHMTSQSEHVEQRALQAVQEVESLQFDLPESPPNEMQDKPCCGCHCQQEAVQQEVMVLREENETLNSTLCQQEDDISKLKNGMMGVREERDRLRRKVRELQSKVQNLETVNCSTKTSTNSSKQTQASQVAVTQGVRSPAATPTSRPNQINPSTGEISASSSDARGDLPVAKVAERRKLKPTGSESAKPGGERPVLGQELLNVGVSNTKIAEHLVHTLQDCSNVQEIFQTLYSHGSAVSEGRIREFEVEMERLNSKIEHLKSQNDLLQLTLEESKANADRLTMLVGKYESNNTALQMAVNYSDQCLDTYDVLLTLLESEQQVILANCRAAGLGNIGDQSIVDEQEEATAMLKRVHDNRKAAENMAKSLLQRMDRSCGAVVCHVPGCTIQPWEDLSSHSHTSTTSSTASSCDTEFTREDEQRLKDYIQQLKNDRAAVRLTMLELESVHIDPLSHDIATRIDSQRLDLENAVLMQELNAVKEEKAELKAQNYLLEKEKKAIELKLSTREAQEQAYLLHIEHLKSEVKVKEQSQARMKGDTTIEKDGSSPGAMKATPSMTLAELSNYELGDIESDPNMPRDLAEAHKREKRLKLRVQELVATLEKLQKNSELRHQQSAEFVSDLKRANSALVTAYEKAKKKHQSRLKKLEAQMMAMVERHETQLRMLKQRIALLEEENATCARPPHNETSL
ncbi:colorectal mutant cancer protein-like isoform X3 [Ptychodera flava]|uniref:colorectal mutant cancer protein-like isoform X3 n=1 Tax=Ptychodera flava TaxID=63121 RepID=UPI00396A6250